MRMTHIHSKKIRGRAEGLSRLPGGLAVECREDRSQHRNKSQAMAALKARLPDMQPKEQMAEAAARKTMIGSGDRSRRIRACNFPQGRVTDHRIGLTPCQLSGIMEGRLETSIEALRRRAQLEKSANDAGDTHSLQ